MEGAESKNGGDVGITQSSVNELWRRVEEQKKIEPTRHFSVFVSFLQIYNEKVFDLLNPNSSGANKLALSDQTGLRIRWTKKDQFVVENLYIFEANSAKEVLDLYKFGVRSRVLASHNLNEVSSRSHSIFSITIES
jgi:hypothetical protein